MKARRTTAAAFKNQIGETQKALQKKS